MKNQKLEKYGFDSFFKDQFVIENKDEFAARIVSQQGDVYTLLTDKSLIQSKIMGKFRYQTKLVKDFPVVGDFVIAKRMDGNGYSEILKVMNRKNVFSRKMPISGGRKMFQGIIDGGITEEQIMAVNIDYVMILCSLESEINVSRLERYMLLAKRSKLVIVVVLTKLDLRQNYEEQLNLVKKVVSEVKIICISTVTGENMELLS